MKISFKIALASILMLCMGFFACKDEIPDDNIPETNEMSSAEAANHDYDSISWTIAEEDFVKEMLAMQELNALGGKDNDHSLVIRKNEKNDF